MSEALYSPADQARRLPPGNIEPDTRRPKVGLLHHVGGGNLGDDATLDAVMYNIKRRWPNAVITAFSNNPEDTRERHGIDSYPIRAKTWYFGDEPDRTDATLRQSVKTLASKYGLLFRLLRTINRLAIRFPKTTFRELWFLARSFRIIKSFDLLVVSGGGQLTEWGGPWEFPYTLFKWILLARTARVRCIFLNVGAGPLTHPLSKFFARRALVAADYVSFRDAKSQLLAHEIGFTGQSGVFPDSAYTLEAPRASVSPMGRRGQAIVGFAPMPHFHPRTSPADKSQRDYDEFIAKCAAFVSWLDQNSYSISLFGSDIGVDPLAIGDLQALLQSRHGVRSGYDPVYSIHELLSTMSAMDYVVTCRFHGVVFAHLVNKPVLAISHHPKVATIMNDLGLSKYCVDIRTFTPDLLADRFTSLVRDREEVKSRMAASLAGYRSKLMAQFDDLFPAQNGD